MGILLNYTAADKDALSICSFEKLKKRKEDDGPQTEGGREWGVGLESTLKSSWKIRLIHSADLAQRGRRGGRLRAPLLFLAPPPPPLFPLPFFFSLHRKTLCRRDVALLLKRGITEDFHSSAKRKKLPP